MSNYPSLVFLQNCGDSGKQVEFIEMEIGALVGSVTEEALIHTKCDRNL
jgi:hypothetical protein